MYTPFSIKYLYINIQFVEHIIHISGKYMDLHNLHTYVTLHETLTISSLVCGSIWLANSGKWPFIPVQIADNQYNMRMVYSFAQKSQQVFALFKNIFLRNRSLSKGPFILHHNCVALPHCTLLHTNCDVTALRCRMKVKLILT